MKVQGKVLDYRKNFELWKNDLFFDEETRQKLQSLDINADAKEIEDCFYQDLELRVFAVLSVIRNL